ncbi:MAG: SDR family oxidoreductase [Rhodospirillales bacterium]|nr:SDR family oxidoreductase [Rhodospirillales bacterium]
MKVFIFGLGYSGKAVARLLAKHGMAVTGTVRHPDEAAGLGWPVVRFERGHRLPAQALAGVTHILSTVPPDDKGDPVIDEAGAAIAAQPGLVWAGYLSTTGVYGDRQGGWVDEDSERRPGLERAKRRAKAEDQWLELWQGRGVPVHLFRLAGIYGPGRSAFDALKAGKAHRVIKEGQVFSRIHVEDIAGALWASMNRPRPGAIYNLCDDDPGPPEAVIAEAARLLGIEPPPAIPFDQAGLSDMAKSFYADNKRVSNRRLKEELGYRLRYPDYRQGLAAILKVWLEGSA